MSFLNVSKGEGCVRWSLDANAQAESKGECWAVPLPSKGEVKGPVDFLPDINVVRLAFCGLAQSIVDSLQNPYGLPEVTVEYLKVVAGIVE